MTKIICGILFAAAFTYALYLVLSKRNLEKIRKAIRLQSAFGIAVFACCAALLFMSSCRNVSEKDAQIKAAESAKAFDMLRAAWLVLDGARYDSFKSSVDSAVKNEVIEKDVAAVLDLTYKNLSAYLAMKKGLSCYDYGAVGMVFINSDKKIFQQLELLSKMRAEDRLSGGVQEKIEEAIAYEIETMREVALLKEDDKLKDFRIKYRNKKIIPENDVKKASTIIVEIEKGRGKWDLTNDSE